VCAFREEEPWSTHGCHGDEYATAVTGPYAREVAPLRLLAPIERLFLDVMEANRRSKVRWIRSHAWQIYTSTEAVSQIKAPAINRRPQ
jgi:hypothetical protein